MRLHAWNRYASRSARSPKRSRMRRRSSVVGRMVTRWYLSVPYNECNAPAVATSMSHPAATKRSYVPIKCWPKNDLGILTPKRITHLCGTVMVRAKNSNSSVRRSTCDVGAGNGGKIASIWILCPKQWYEKLLEL